MLILIQACCRVGAASDGGGFSVDLRERMAAGVEAGASRPAVAARFSFSPSCVIKLMQCQRDDGTLAPRKMQKRQAMLASHHHCIRALVAETPDATIDELQERLAAEGVVISRSPLGRCPPYKLARW